MTSSIADRAHEAYERRPGFFDTLVDQRAPRYMWIACSDSRARPGHFACVQPAQVFVHRNTGNLVIRTDTHLTADLRFAVERLQVETIFVAGHYGCSSVHAGLHAAAGQPQPTWLRHIQATRRHYQPLIESLPLHLQLDALCELNVLEQVVNVCTLLSGFWDRGYQVSVAGHMCGPDDSVLVDLGITTDSCASLLEQFVGAVERVARRHSLLHCSRPSPPL